MKLFKTVTWKIWAKPLIVCYAGILPVMLSVTLMRRYLSEVPDIEEIVDFFAFVGVGTVLLPCFWWVASRYKKFKRAELHRVLKWIMVILTALYFIQAFIRALLLSAGIYL